MQIALPPKIKSSVDGEVASGRFADAQHVVIEALQLMADDRSSTMTVDEAIADSLVQIERGEGRELTDDVYDELLKQSEIDAERGTQARNEVRY